MAAENPVFSVSSEGMHIPNGDAKMMNGIATNDEISNEVPTISKSVPYFNATDSTLTLVTAEEASSPDLSSGPSSVSSVTKHPEHKEDTTLALVAQIVAAMIVAGIGTVGAGLLLDTVQEWSVYHNVSEMFIMVPPLLGLKGNLEMTLASRLSTLAHLGVLNEANNRWRNFGGNLALTQTQAITFACLASLVAVFLGAIRTRQLRFVNLLLLCASGMVAASGAALFLGILMISVILAARRCRINPDNIATPLAASFGDLLTRNIFPAYRTLGIFSAVGLGLETRSFPLPAGIISFFAVLAPTFAFFAWQIPSSRSVLIHGWTPVLIALLIASCGGFILEMALQRFSSMAPYQPVINGLGGNLAAVLASRLSTHFHQFGDSLLPEGRCVNPLRGFWGSSSDSRCARILLLVVLPGQTIFMVIIHYVSGGFGDENKLTVWFALAYLGAAFLQVFILLNITFWLVPMLWRFRFNPDNWAIPLLTALGDLLGTGLLTIAFYILSLIDGR